MRKELVPEKMDKFHTLTQQSDREVFIDVEYIYGFV